LRVEASIYHDGDGWTVGQWTPERGWYRYHALSLIGALWYVWRKRKQLVR
jgi:hypothetical protein